MNVFITRDRSSYRRWVNALPCFLIPGSAQFLSGRRQVAVIWLISCILLVVVKFIFLLCPESSYETETFHWLDVLDWVFQISLLVDACRRPILRLGVRGWGKYLGVYLLLIIGLVSAALAVRQFLVQPFRIPTGAMEPTIRGAMNGSRGDQVLVNKTAYRKHSPQRGDVVVFKTNGIKHPSVNKSAIYIKRVVGLPGETVSITPPTILINGEPVTEPEILVAISKKQNGYDGYTFAHTAHDVEAVLVGPTNSITLGEDEYLVFGDNSKTSLDGRYFGPIKKSSILGEVFYRYAPAGKKGRIE